MFLNGAKDDRMQVHHASPRSLFYASSLFPPFYSNNNKKRNIFLLFLAAVESPLLCASVVLCVRAHRFSVDGLMDETFTPTRLA